MKVGSEKLCPKENKEIIFKVYSAIDATIYKGTMKTEPN